MVVARVERIPPPSEEEPRAEVHWCRIARYTDIPLLPCAIAGRDIHASAQRYGEMGKVPANTHPLLITLRRGPIASRMVIAELNTTVNILANGLDALPATRDVTKQRPSQVAQLLRLHLADGRSPIGGECCPPKACVKIFRTEREFEKGYKFKDLRDRCPSL
jgi:hypothetical protein